MKTNQKITLIILGTVALIGIAITTFLMINARQPEDTSDEAELVLDCPMTNGIVTYPGETGKTALEILESICKIETKASSEGTIITVTAIDDVIATSPAYWAFYINDTPALVSPNNYPTQPTDAIKWQLESIGN